MNCADFRARLHEYFAQTLPAPQLAEIDRHAEACGSCGELMGVARELSCKDFVGFLNRYIDDELESERRAVFDRHVSICPDCRSYLDSYRKTMNLSIQALRGPALAPEEIPDELLRAILAARGRK